MTTEVDLIVTAHPALADYLRSDCGIVADRVIPHASTDDVRGTVVAGVLPLALAAMCSEAYLVDVVLPAQLRSKELDLADIRALQPQLRRYSVWDLTDDWPAELDLPFDFDSNSLPYNDLLCKLGFEFGWRIGERLCTRYDAGERNFGGADLNGADLTGANLAGADLSGAKLNGATLSCVKLSGAKLSGAKLSGAYLVGADLRGSDLSDANLSGADLACADLRGSDLSDANLSGAGGLLDLADLKGADLSGAQITGTGLDVQGQLDELLADEPAPEERNGPQINFDTTQADWERLKRLQALLSDHERGMYTSRAQTLRCALKIAVGAVTDQDRELARRLIHTGNI